MKIKFYIYLLCAAFLISSGVQAESVKRLYETEVAVLDQGADARQQAMQAALKTVLVRVSGHSIIADEPAVIEALGQPTRYVQQYRYHSVDVPAEIFSDVGSEMIPGMTRSTDVAADATVSQLMLKVRFNSKSINQLLRSNHLPLWGSARPATLVWLAVEEQGVRRIISSNEQSIVKETMDEQTARRGLPVHFPLLDLQDQLRLQPADVWGEFQDVILAASSRYRQEAVLAGRLYWDTAGYWQMYWNLYIGEEIMHWETAATNLDELLTSGVDKVADALSIRFAQVVGEAGRSTLMIEVHDVTDFSAYDRVRGYLKGLDTVAEVQVFEVNADTVVYKLRLTGSVQNLGRAISLGDTLVALDSSVPAISPEIDNVYLSPPLENQIELSFRLLR